MTQNQNVYRQVTAAALIMMLSVLLSRIAGFAREVILAWIGGAGPMVDAYQVAFIIPDILNHVVASGFMSVTFIPIFSRYLAAGDERGGWKAFSNILFCFGTLLFVLVVVCMIYTPQLVRLAAPGLTEPIMYDYAASMTRIIMPAQLCFFVGGLLMAVQFAKERFLIPALAPLVYNLGIIAGGLLLGPFFGVFGFAWGVLLGSLVGNLGLQLLGARLCGLHIYPAFNPFSRDLIKYTVVTIPLIIGVSITFSTEFVIRFFGSFLGMGRVAALNYALRVMLLLVGFFGQAVGTASYPFMAKLAANGDMKGLNALLDKTVRYLALLIPLSMLFIALRYEIIRVLFQRGNFTPDDTMLTAPILGFMMVGACAFALYTVVVRGFYAVQNTWFPALFGLLCLAAAVPFYVWAAVYLHNARALALMISLVSIVQVVVLYLIWARKTRNRGARAVVWAYIEMLVVSLVACVPLFAFKYVLFGVFDPANSFGYCLTACVACGLFYGILGLWMGWLFEIEEITFGLKKLLRKGS